MTNTTTEILTVDGVVLNTLAYNIEAIAGRLRTPPVRSGNVVVPGRHGSVRTTRKMYGEGSFELPMLVRGYDDDGLVVGDRRTKFFKNIDKLTELFAPDGDLLDVRHTLPDASVRQCYAEVLDVLDFSHDAWADPFGKFVVGLTVPAAFWQDTADLTQTFTNPTLNTALSMSSFAGATAPMEDLVITITGPITNPKVEVLRGGNPLSVPNWFQYTGTIAGGTTLIVNCSTWTISGTSSPSYANFTHSGGGRFLSVVPGVAAAAPAVRLTGSGNSASTAISLVGRRKYLVG